MKMLPHHSFKYLLFLIFLPWIGLRMYFDNHLKKLRKENIQYDFKMKLMPPMKSFHLHKYIKLLSWIDYNCMTFWHTLWGISAFSRKDLCITPSSSSFRPLIMLRFHGFESEIPMCIFRSLPLGSGPTWDPTWIQINLT